jgi:hypothetical protein
MRGGAFVLCAAMLGCAGSMGPMLRPSAQAQPNQDVIYRAGMVIVTSKEPGSEVMIEPVAGPTGRYKLGDRVGYVVSIRNLSSHRIEVSEASVSATANSQPAHVFRATEIEDQIRKQEAWAQALNFVVGVAEGATSRSGFGKVLAAERTAARSGAIQANATAQGNALGSWALQRTTLEPGEVVTGGVSIDAPRRAACPRYIAYETGATYTNAASPRADTNTAREAQQGEGYRSGGACVWTVSVKVGTDVHTFRLGETLENPT